MSRGGSDAGNMTAKAGDDIGGDENGRETVKPYRERSRQTG